MKNVLIEKSVDNSVTDAQLEIINRYTRRALEKDEVFVFSLILCDNEIDRDLERFPRDSLAKLAELYKGKTGVFDHSPKAENQSARIFDTIVTEDGSENSLGEPYCCVKAWAYMARSEENRGLIMEIDAGIKKEVSVGCAVEKTVCSVCGADIKAAPCGHKKGDSYDGKPCHHLLINPTDAYEWSFVAVPAQKNAGVTKGYKAAPVMFEDNGDALEKLFSLKHPGGVTIPLSRLEYLGREFKNLSALAEAGEEYVKSMRRDAVKHMLSSQPELPPALAGELAEKMNPNQLKQFTDAFKKSALKSARVYSQLAPAENSGHEDYTDDGFKI